MPLKQRIRQKIKCKFMIYWSYKVENGEQRAGAVQTILICQEGSSVQHCTHTRNEARIHETWKLQIVYRCRAWHVMKGQKFSACFCFKKCHRMWQYQQRVQTFWSRLQHWQWFWTVGVPSHYLKGRRPRVNCHFPVNGWNKMKSPWTQRTPSCPAKLQLPRSTNPSISPV